MDENIDNVVALADICKVLQGKNVDKKKTYFKKSRSWLAHKLNGNIVNGKPSQFTDEELKTLRFALNDMSTKLNAMSLAL